MIARLGSLFGWPLHASNGEIGRLKDCFFDDHHWSVRYFVVRPGGRVGFSGVLILPNSVNTPDWTSRRLYVRLSSEQVRSSPHYWTSEPLAWLETHASSSSSSRESLDHQESRMRSMLEILGYHLHARDGHLGHVDDLLVNDRNWHIRYLQITTARGRRTVLIPSDYVRVDGFDSTILVDVSTVVVASAPRWNPSQAVTRMYEERLRTHYGARAVVGEKRMRSLP
jgi:hypothetical protein